MTTTTPGAPDEKRLDPEVPKRLAHFAAWENSLAPEDRDDAFAVFEYFVDGKWHAITIGDLLQLHAREEYARHEGQTLAEQCATYRGRIEELAAVLREVLGGYWQKGEVGYRAVRTHWIKEDRLDGWRRTLAGTPAPTEG